MFTECLFWVLSKNGKEKDQALTLNNVSVGITGRGLHGANRASGGFFLEVSIGPARPGSGLEPFLGSACGVILLSHAAFFGGLWSARNSFS